MNSPAHLLEQGRDWLDGHGKMAWIAFMVLGFIFAGPLGLIILFYMIGTNRMGKFNSKNRRNRHCGRNTSGNMAFDNYRDETMKRLEDEQSAFQNFLGNLRAAKDRAEFDDFMTSHKRSDEDQGQAPA